MPLSLNPRALAKLDEPGTPAFPVVIRELTGPSRQIVLQGRSLPYRGVAWEGEQRMEIKWYPGNPVGTAQVLGAKYMPTTMEGMWKDVFLQQQDSRAALANFPAVSGPGRPGSRVVGGKSFQSAGSVPQGYAEKARTLRDAFSLLQKSGQLLRVEWASMARYGFLRRARFEHQNESDIRWELEFEWLGETDAQPRPRLIPKLDPLGLLARIVKALQSALDALNRALALVYGSVQIITQGIRRLGALVTGFITAIQGFIELLFIPSEIFGVAKQQLTSIALAAKDLVNSIRGTPAAYQKRKDGGDPNGVNAAAGIAAAVLFNTQRLGITAADAANELDDIDSPEILGVFTATGQETLRDVSTRFYGSPANWSLIKEFNGLPSSQVPRGTVLQIPRVDAKSNNVNSA